MREPVLLVPDGETYEVSLMPPQFSKIVCKSLDLSLVIRPSQADYEERRLIKFQSMLPGFCILRHSLGWIK